MSRPAAPSMPTPHQIQETHKTVVALHPGARIIRVGADFIEFEYPDGKGPQDAAWQGKPFSAEAS